MPQKNNSQDNISQSGNAGRDLIQVAGNYIHYIQRKALIGDWGAVMIALVPLFLFLYGGIVAGQQIVRVFDSSPNASSNASSNGNVEAREIGTKPSPDTSQNNLHERCVTVITPELNVRTKPNQNSGIVGALTRGAQPSTTGETADNWLKINAPYEGWINGGSIYTQPCEKPLPTVASNPTYQSTANTNRPEPTEATDISRKEAEETARQVALQQQREAEETARQAALQQQREAEAARQVALRRQREAEAAAEAERRRTTCIVTISNSLVSLMSEHDTFSRELTRLPAGDYTPIQHTIVDKGFLGQEAWFEIEVNGRTGWIRDDSWTLSDKSSPCP